MPKNNSSNPWHTHTPMLILLSPSKTLDFSPTTHASHSTAHFLKETKLLVDILKCYSEDKLASLMDISASLAALNKERFNHFSFPFTLTNAKQAVLAFKGDVYDGLQANNWDNKTMLFAQEHICILSGLYGILKPLDLIQPYRLEMGIKLKNQKGKDLYQFWGKQLTDYLNHHLSTVTPPLLINLASQEYFKAIHSKALPFRIITPLFKDTIKGNLKVVMVYAKKARGMMAHYIVRDRIASADLLKNFNDGGYRYNTQLSNGDEWVFIR